MNFLHTNKIRLITIVFSLFTFVLLQVDSVFAESQDISTLESIDDFYTDLDGEWYFIPEKLLTLQEMKEENKEELGMKVELPSSFSTQINKENSFGTYYKKFMIPDEFIGHPMAIHIQYQYSAYSLMVDGIKILENGIVGRDSDTHQAEMAPKTGYFIPDNNEVEILIHVSSFDHIRGGLENPIYIGEAQLVTKKFTTKINIDLFLISSLIIMGIFTVSFVFLRRQEKGFIIFGVFCFFVALRAFFSDPFYYTLWFSNISWLWGTRMEYILSLLSSWVFVILLKSWYPESFSKKVVYALTLVLLPTAVITLFTQPVFFQDLFFKIAILAIPVSIYFIYLTYKETKDNNRRAQINIIGLFLIFIAFLNDFAQGVNLYQFQPLMLAATALYVLLHVIQMSVEYAKLNESLEEVNQELVNLNASLDQEVYDRTVELKKVNKLLQRQAMRDSLTNIANRRSFDRALKKYYVKAIEKHQPLSTLMLDVDEFKKYNDFFGHRKGDWLLQKIVATILEKLPKDSFFARYGGEEFAIILPNKTKLEAFKIAERIRITIEEKNYSHPKSKENILTCSIGVSTLTENIEYDHEEKLVDAADAQLYKAKQAGRNRVM